MRRLLRALSLENFARLAYHSTKQLARDAVLKDRRILAEYLSSTEQPKLNLGCGKHLMPGWLNSDFHPTVSGVFHLNATRRFPFADAVFDRVYSEHMIEHVAYQDGRNMLRESFRVLKPGGRIRVSTPDMQFLFQLYNGSDGISAKYLDWARTAYEPSTNVAVINSYFRSWGHQFIYDESTLKHLLATSGFVDIARHEVSRSSDPTFRELENTQRMPEGFLALETLVLEATRPG